MGERTLKFKDPQYGDQYSMSAKLLGLFGGTLRESKNREIGTENSNGNHQERINRNWFLRRQRRIIHKEIMATDDKNSRRDLLRSAHEFDILAAQLENVRQVGVQTEWGELKSGVVELNLKPAEDQKTIVIIPGVSNDPSGVGRLAMEGALRGNRVMVVGYPEGWQGESTEAFGEAVAKAPDFRPHASFFIQALEKENVGEKYELWGYSTGGAVVADMMDNDDIQSRTDKVVLVCPAGCRNINKLGGLLKEQWKSLKDFWKTSSLIPVNVHQVEITPEKRRAMLSTFEPLSEKALSQTDWWENQGVQAGANKMTIVTYDNDPLTKAVEVVDEFRKTGMTVIEMKGHHSTPLMHPEKVFDRLDNDR